MMITREKLVSGMVGIMGRHKTDWMLAFRVRCARELLDFILPNLNAELSTAELPVQGEAVALAESITLSMLKNWCHTNRFRIEIDLGGVATAGTFGNMRRLWDADLLTMFPTLNQRRESDTPTLKPSVNELDTPE
jgi:hypothetical protein